MTLEMPNPARGRIPSPRCLLPFLFPAKSGLWAKHKETLSQFFPVGEIFALQPAQALWYKPFVDWTTEDWGNPKHLSILWSINSGTVKCSACIHTREEVRNSGETFAETVRK